MRKDKGDYYIKMDMVSFEQGNTTGEIPAYESLLLKDYLDVNESWTGYYSYKITYNLSNVPPVNTTVDYTGTILEKGTSLAVRGVKYNNVIEFRVSQKTADIVMALGEVKTYTSEEGTTELVTYTLK